MENPLELKPIEPVQQPESTVQAAGEPLAEPKVKYKIFSLGKIISIFTAIVLFLVVLGIVLYSQSGERYKGALNDAVKETTVTKSDAVILTNEQKCSQYKQSLDAAFYDRNWVTDPSGTNQNTSYTSALTLLENASCFDPCELNFYKAVLHSAVNNYGNPFDPNNPTNFQKETANYQASQIATNCGDKTCQYDSDLAVIVAGLMGEKPTYDITDKAFMENLLDMTIKNCPTCIKTDAFGALDSTSEKYFEKVTVQQELQTVPESTDIYLERAVPQEQVSETKPLDTTPAEMVTNDALTMNESLLNEQAATKAEQLTINDAARNDSISTAGAVTETKIIPNENKTTTTTDLVPTSTKDTSKNLSTWVTVAYADSAIVQNHIKSYLIDKCPAACGGLKIISPTAEDTLTLSANDTLQSPLKIEVTNPQNIGTYEYKTQTGTILFNDANTDYWKTLDPNESVNLLGGPVPGATETIIVNALDLKFQPVAGCTDTLIVTRNMPAVITEETATETTTATTTAATTEGNTTASTSSSTSGTSTGTTSSSGSTSGSVAGGSIPRCNSLEIVVPPAADKQGHPEVVLSENGYINEPLTIKVKAAAGSVSGYRFKSVNGTITFDGQGTTYDTPEDVKTVRMNGGPNPGEEDTITVWALGQGGTGLSSCNDAFIVKVPAPQVASAPVETIQEPQTELIPAVLPAVEPITVAEPEPASTPLLIDLHEGAETPEEVQTPANATEMPPQTPDDGPGVLVYFIGAGLGGLIFSRKKKQK